MGQRKTVRADTDETKKKIERIKCVQFTVLLGQLNLSKIWSKFSGAPSVISMMALLQR